MVEIVGCCLPIFLFGLVAIYVFRRDRWKRGLHDTGVDAVIAEIKTKIGRPDRPNGRSARKRKRSGRN